METRQKPIAVVLLSGGLDSSTALAVARHKGFVCHALTFDYAQRHQLELAAARRVGASMGVVQHRIIRIDLSARGGFGHSALTDDINVPKDHDSLEKTGQSIAGIPVTYVPARNTIFLAIALGYAEVVGAFDIFIGVNAVDFSGYPDCRPAFIKAFQKLANLATAVAVEGKGKFTIHAPLIKMTKAQIVKTGLSLGVDYGLTHSCYDPAPDGGPCGHCDSCRLRRKGFKEAGAVDPLVYLNPE